MPQLEFQDDVHEKNVEIIHRLKLFNDGSEGQATSKKPVMPPPVLPPPPLVSCAATSLRARSSLASTSLHMLYQPLHWCEAVQHPL